MFGSSLAAEPGNINIARSTVSTFAVCGMFEIQEFGDLLDTYPKSCVVMDAKLHALAVL
jgi:hypothetical protein